MSVKDLALSLLLCIMSYASYQVWQLELHKKKIKEDLIELSDIKYGMFNVDEWERQFAAILTRKIEGLNLTGANKEKARKSIENFLYTAIENFERSYKKENKKSAFLGISLKNWGASIFKIFGGLKGQVPNITNDLLRFLEDENNRKRLKDYILEQLEKYKQETFQEIDYTLYNHIISTYEAEDKMSTILLINEAISDLEQEVEQYFWVLFTGFLFLGVWIMLASHFSQYSIVLLIFIASELLMIGIMLPMIGIDARIGFMEFQLLGESIVFEDQVLYYKSKSILEMSSILLKQGDLKVIAVGLLIILFSIVFPLSKLISSAALLFKSSLYQNPLVRFLVYKSGKWSMADVMVVAIFMSYIGFAGIISSQLKQLEQLSASLNIITTNQSQLQAGFYFFLGFVLLSILISQLISSQIKHFSHDSSKLE